MNTTLIATVIEEGAKLAGDVIRHTVMRARSRPHDNGSSEISKHEPPDADIPANNNEPSKGGIETPSPQSETPHISTSELPKSYIPEHASGESGYRMECCLKHLGGASVLLREAFERANDEGIGKGTAEKIIEAMNEHSAMEADLEKMLPIEDVRDVTERLLSGTRQFRASAWKAGLPRGEGSKDDVEAARMWNNILLNETITAAQKYPGSQCIREGM